MVCFFLCCCRALVIIHFILNIALPLSLYNYTIHVEIICFFFAFIVSLHTQTQIHSVSYMRAGMCASVCVWERAQWWSGESVTTFATYKSINLCVRLHRNVYEPAFKWAKICYIYTHTRARLRMEKESKREMNVKITIHKKSKRTFCQFMLTHAHTRTHAHAKLLPGYYLSTVSLWSYNSRHHKLTSYAIVNMRLNDCVGDSPLAFAQQHYSFHANRWLCNAD